MTFSMRASGSRTKRGRPTSILDLIRFLDFIYPSLFINVIHFRLPDLRPQLADTSNRRSAHKLRTQKEAKKNKYSIIFFPGIYCPRGQYIKILPPRAIYQNIALEGNIYQILTPQSVNILLYRKICRAFINMKY